MSIRKEEWRDIPGYEGWYQASDWGRVRSFRKRCNKANCRNEAPRIMNPYHDKKKKEIKYRLSLGDRKELVPAARITAITFLGGIPEGMVAYHKNGDITNNSVWNVAIKPWKDMIHRYTQENGKRTRRRPVVKMDSTLTVVECYSSARQAGNANRIGHRTICDYCSLLCKRTVFAPDGYIYAWDDDNWIHKTIQRAMAELDAIGIRYNNPFTSKYYDLQEAPDLDLDPDILWSEAPACWGGYPFGIHQFLIGA